MSIIIYSCLLLLVCNPVYNLNDDIEIIDTGIFDISDEDIAVIFYLTLRNSGEKNADISVSVNKCCDQTNSLEDEECVQMYVMGGYMGVLKKHQVQNVTLIHPTLYPYRRKGVCSVTVSYRTDKYDRNIIKVINFQTNSSDGDLAQDQCQSVDTDPRDNCNQVDCVIKYFGEKSYFNPISKECEKVPICLSESTILPDITYNYISNQCINLNNTVTEADLELLENNQGEISNDSPVNSNNKICHHGEFNTLNPSEECVCMGNWKTTLDNAETYEPSLLLYHMCNIEVGSWNCVNRTKIQTTVLIVLVLTVTIASKILLLMCILSWCYKHFRKQKPVIICTKEKNSDDLEKLLIQQPFEYNECICSKLQLHDPFQRLQQETIDISYYPGGMDKRISFGKSLPDTSNSRLHKEQEFSIEITQSTSTTSIDDEYIGSTENEDTKGSFEDDNAKNKKYLKRSVESREDSNTTDYSIRLSQTTSSPPPAQSETERNEEK